MNVFGSTLHLVTFILICLELFIFVFKLCFYVLRPDEYHRVWFLILLILLVMYNLANGLYPDPKIDLALNLQNMLKYGSGFLTAAYFPFYFYKTYNLKTLRFHAFYGTFLFLIMPYLIFFVFIYAMNNNLEFAINYGFIVPFFYGIVLLRDIPKAIRLMVTERGNREEYLKALAVFAGLSPWFALIILEYFHASHLLEVLLANLGILVITVILLLKTIKRVRKESIMMMGLDLVTSDPVTVTQYCKQFELTARETDVVSLICQRFSYGEIAEKLFISKRTVDKHVENIFSKINVTTKTELIRKMNGL